jgi:predicted ribosome quality control (RQC) complex YloA/Tae2 family protein
MFAEGVVLKKGDTVWELRCGPRELHWQALSPPETLGPPWRKSRRNEAFVLGKHLLASAALSSIDARRLSLKRALDKARGRVARRKDAILGDLERMREVQATAAQAQAFVAAAKGAPRGAKQLTITDWTSGEARERTFPLDPAKSAREQLEAVFRRAKRLRESAPLVETRLQATADSLAMLEHLAASLGQASTAEAFDAITQDARKAAPRDFAMALSLVAPGRAGKTSPRREARLPYRTFRGQDGDRILVGRGAADNDALTFHVGKPHDLWLHAKDQGGAHVIVPLAKGKVCPPALLVEAAHLAAHFSDKRDELLVDVQYTPKKFLRKPKGSAPGFVIVEREKVLVLRKDSQLLARLLAEEELP